jgi:hypothetical protein
MRRGFFLRRSNRAFRLLRASALIIISTRSHSNWAVIVVFFVLFLITVEVAVFKLFFVVDIEN